MTLFRLGRRRHFARLSRSSVRRARHLARPCHLGGSCLCSRRWFSHSLIFSFSRSVVFRSFLVRSFLVRALVSQLHSVLDGNTLVVGCCAIHYVLSIQFQYYPSSAFVIVVITFVNLNSSAN